MTKFLLERHVVVDTCKLARRLNYRGSRLGQRMGLGACYVIPSGVRVSVTSLRWASMFGGTSTETTDWEDEDVGALNVSLLSESRA